MYDVYTKYFLNTKQDFSGGFSADEIWFYQDKSGIAQFYYDILEDNESLQGVGIKDIMINTETFILLILYIRSIK